MCNGFYFLVAFPYGLSVGMALDCHVVTEDWAYPGPLTAWGQRLPEGRCGGLRGQWEEMGGVWFRGWMGVVKDRLRPKSHLQLQ